MQYAIHSTQHNSQYKTVLYIFLLPKSFFTGGTGGGKKNILLPVALKCA
jgi:hypothetical protein